MNVEVCIGLHAECFLTRKCLYFCCCYSVVFRVICETGSSSVFRVTACKRFCGIMRYNGFLSSFFEILDTANIREFLM